MDDYTILLQANPDHSAIADFYQSGFLFNEFTHLQQQQNGRFHLLTAINNTTRQTEARCAFLSSLMKLLAPVQPRLAP